MKNITTRSTKSEILEALKAEQGKNVVLTNRLENANEIIRNLQARIVEIQSEDYEDSEVKGPTFISSVKDTIKTPFRNLRDKTKEIRLRANVVTRVMDGKLYIKTSKGWVEAETE